jgi:hypothetical protein
MPSSMTLIQSATVGAGTAATVTFTSIPQTYTDLIVKISSRGTDPSNFQVIRMYFNNVEGTFRELYGTNGTVGSSGISQNRGGYTSAANNTANTFGNAEVYIPNYTSSVNKAASADAVSENNGAVTVLTLVSNNNPSNSPITSLTFFPDGNNWAQHSTFYLYGVTKYVEVGTGSKATGGTVTTSGGFTYHTFFNSGMFTPTTNITGAEILVVAGGGAGGGNKGGGGGAGGVSYLSSASLTSGIGYSAIIGAGGQTAADGTSYNVGFGTNSIFNNIISNGGGYGGNDNNAGATQSGGTGGSGGAASRAGSAGGTNQGSTGGATGYGFAGGAGINSDPYGGGGGGGAGGAGQAPTGGSNGNGGAGGVGLSTWSAWLTATGTGVAGFIAGGGGGGLYSAGGFNGGGAAGLGGGGQGGNNNGAGVETVRPTAGVPNTGGGGGGAGNQGGTTGVGGGASGGSGLVIVRYTT